MGNPSLSACTFVSILVGICSVVAATVFLVYHQIHISSPHCTYSASSLEQVGTKSLASVPYTNAYGQPSVTFYLMDPDLQYTHELEFAKGILPALQKQVSRDLWRWWGVTAVLQLDSWDKRKPDDVSWPVFLLPHTYTPLADSISFVTPPPNNIASEATLSFLQTLPRHLPTTLIQMPTICPEPYHSHYEGTAKESFDRCQYNLSAAISYALLDLLNNPSGSAYTLVGDEQLVRLSIVAPLKGETYFVTPGIQSYPVANFLTPAWLMTKNGSPDEEEQDNRRLVYDAAQIHTTKQSLSEKGFLPDVVSRKPTSV